MAAGISSNDEHRSVGQDTRRQLAAKPGPHEERKAEHEGGGAEVEFGNTTRFGLPVIFNWGILCGPGGVTGLYFIRVAEAAGRAAVAEVAG